MGTIYQPEAAAEAVLLAARTGAREYWVGTSTLMTIVGNMIAPEFMDWFLARTAVSGQDRRRLVQAERRDNLMKPITDLHRAHGSFDAEAKPHATIYPGTETRAAIVAGGAADLLCARASGGPACEGAARLPLIVGEPAA